MTHPISPPSSAAAPPRSTTWVVALCFAIIVFDGYDLGVYGATVPSLLDYQPWRLDPARVGAIGSYALIGMLLGGLLSGWFASLLGTRRIVLGSLIWFSILMGLTALAPNPEVFGLLRFLAGLGLGAVVPTVISLTAEYSPPSRRQFTNALMLSGYPGGGLAAAVAGLALLPENSFRVMYAIGLLPLVTVVPLVWRYLPESISYLHGRGRSEEAHALAERYGLTTSSSGDQHSAGSMRTLLNGPRKIPLALMVFASCCSLLLVYGVNTWLPNIMRQAGYSLGSSLSFLLILNLGAIGGSLIASRVGDRFGGKPVTVVSFLLAVISILGLSVGLSLPVAMSAVAVAGIGTVGTQILIAGYVATYFDRNERTAALGLQLGLGRVGAIFGPIVGGWIAASSLGFEWNFYVFSAVAVVGCVSVALVRRNNTQTPCFGVDSQILRENTSAEKQATS